MPLWHEVVWPDAAEWIRLPLVILALGGLIGVGELLRKLMHASPEFSRKFVHIGVGAALLLGPRLFISPIPMLVLSVVFAASNAVAIKAGGLRGMHGPSRRSLGTVYFPISLFILTVLFWHCSPELVVLAMFSFSMGDAAAAIVGESLKHPRTYTLSGDAKSLEGSLAMFVFSAASIVFGLWVLAPQMLSSWMFVVVMAASSAVLATAWEALSSRGLDNIAVPLSHGLVLAIFFFPSTVSSIQQFSLGLSLGLGIAVVAYSVRALSASGAVATSILATVVFGLGGWKWTMPIVVFFMFSSALSFVGRKWKSDLDTVFEKSSTRDHGQVAANGAIACSLVILHFAVPGIDWYPAYVGAVAAVTADTWGTEIGILFRGRTVSLIGFREVPRGSNGGVSVAGSLAAEPAAALIGAVGAQWTRDWTMAVVGILAGMAGATADSLLGETLQARFRCVVCGRETERTVHCETSTEHTGGLLRLRNDGVNWACAAVGVAVAYLISMR
mgnify:CR=1 FL=1